MQLIDYLDVLRRQWRFVLTFLVLGALGGAALALLSSKSYEAHTTLIIHVESAADNPTQAYDGSLLSQQLAKSYVHLVQEGSVARDTAAQLHPSPSVAALQSAISARTVTDTSLIVLAARDSSPARAQTIANTLAGVFAQHVKQVQTVGTQSPASASAVVIDPATRPLHPVTSGPVRLGLFGGLLGLFIGFGVAVLRERSDDKVRTPEDVWQTVGVRTLGNLGEHPDGDDGELGDEQVRQLKTNVQFAGNNAARGSLLITSAEPEEGKTTVACALARALAATGRRVVLVDADLRQAEGGSALRSRRARGRRTRPAGLSDVLLQHAEVHEVVSEWEGQGLDVVMSGTAVHNPGELLSDPALAMTLAALEQQYDHVVVDAPAVLPYADASVIAQVVSGVLVVVRHGTTTRDDLSRAIANLDLVDAPVIGVVLNRVPRQHPGSDTHAPSTVSLGHRPPLEGNASRHSAASVPTARHAEVSLRERGL